MLRVAILVLCAVVLLPGSSAAQDAPATDPEAGSPSGTVYELPLDGARKDAAPRTSPRKSPRRGGRDGPAGQAPSGGSPIRSENNFGSSSQVPGVDGDGGDAAAGSGSGEGGKGDTRLDSGEQGEKSKRPTAGIGIQRASADADGPEWGLILPLIALLVLIGATSGRLAARARKG